MRPLLLCLVLIVVVRPSAAGAAPPSPAAPDHVRIVNAWPRTLQSLYLSSTDRNEDWEDSLGPDVVRPGASAVVALNGTSCVYDLKAVFDDGGVAFRYRIDFCKVDTYTLTP